MPSRDNHPLKLLKHFVSSYNEPLKESAMTKSVHIVESNTFTKLIGGGKEGGGKKDTYRNLNILCSCFHLKTFKSKKQIL